MMDKFFLFYIGFIKKREKAKSLKVDLQHDTDDLLF